MRVMLLLVVSYRNSTSNHNTVPVNHYQNQLYLIEILHQTTTIGAFCRTYSMLYLIEILHQTTTTLVANGNFSKLYLIEILHQTTTRVARPLLPVALYLIEILHQTTTAKLLTIRFIQLYLIEILHQTTTVSKTIQQAQSCILSKFYIKPQPGSRAERVTAVVSYRNSTSNHNVGPHID